MRWLQACTGYRDSLPRKAAILAACVLSLGLVLVSGVYGLPGQLPRKAAILAACVLSLGLVLVSGVYGLPGQPAEEGRHLGCVRAQSGPGAGFRRVRVTGTACRGRPPSWLRACSVWAWCWFQACTGYRDSLPRKAAILAACVLSLGLVLVSGVYGLPGQPAEEGRHLGCVRAQSGPGAGFRRVRVTGTACRGRPPSWLRACSVWAWCCCCSTGNQRGPSSCARRNVRWALLTHSFFRSSTCAFRYLPLWTLLFVASAHIRLIVYNNVV